MVDATSGIGTPGLARLAPLPRWLVLLQGIIALALGILLLAYPVGTLVVLIIFLGAYWLVNGIFVLASLFSDRSDLGWKLLVGILGILGGILLLVYPLYSTILIPTILAILIGVEGLLIGVVQLARGFGGAGWGAGILGIVSIIFGLILIANPFVAAIGLVVVFAILAIVGGILAIIFAIRMPG